MKIALIGCSKKKLGFDNRLKEYKAKCIYQGNSFKKSKAYVEDKSNEFDDYFILSAKHGLLEKDTKIVYYDQTLNNAPKKEKQEWAKRVLDELKSKFDLSKVEFHIFAGKNYYEYLRDYINCTTYTFQGRNIVFDNPTSSKRSKQYD